MCFPSIAPKQLGIFHLFQYPSAIFFHCSSVGHVKYIGFNLFIIIGHTSLINCLTVDCPTRKENVIFDVEFPVARYLKMDQKKFCYIIISCDIFIIMLFKHK